MRIATYAAPLSRDGPGLLLRDLLRGEDPVLRAIASVVSDAAPDVLVLTDFDYDHDGVALRAFADRFPGRFPFVFAKAPNAGMPTGLDIDGNGRKGEARDAQGYGRFMGDGGLAILSHFPIDATAVADYSDLLWRDLPQAVLPQSEGAEFLAPAVRATLRLSSTAHWVVPVQVPGDWPLSIMAFAATPPVFDGPEDMNGLRARDELRLWEHVLDGHYGPPPAGFVVAGNSNLDPAAGDGDRAAMRAFLARPDLQDAHAGSTNADWGEDGPGRLRVSSLLASRDWQIVDAGTHWPATGPKDAAGPHGLVWVDLRR